MIFINYNSNDMVDNNRFLNELARMMIIFFFWWPPSTIYNVFVISIQVYFFYLILILFIWYPYNCHSLQKFQIFNLFCYKIMILSFLITFYIFFICDNTVVIMLAFYFIYINKYPYAGVVERKCYQHV